jgi:hypothetical protein
MSETPADPDLYPFGTPASPEVSIGSSNVLSDRFWRELAAAGLSVGSR